MSEVNSPRSKIFIIAEVGQAHEGSLGIAHSYIDALVKTGVDAVKFQTHIAEAESSAIEPFRIKFSYEDKTRYEYWQRMEFTSEQWAGLKEHCDNAGVEFISSPFSIAAINILESLGVSRYKVGSGEVENYLLLRRILETGKPIILSSGMSTFSELRRAVEYIKPFGNYLSILQCTTAYPTKPNQWGLNVMGELSDEFRVPIGFSDHSGEIYACLAAAALGAQILEFHAVFDKRMFGPDSAASLTIDEIKNLVHGVRQIENAIVNPVRKDESVFSDLKLIFGKSLAVNKALKRGHVLGVDDLESKKPANCGISASAFAEVVGKKLVTDLQKFSFLEYRHLE